MKTATGSPFATTDTPKEIVNVQIALLRKAGLAGRAQRSFWLSKTAIELSRRAIKRRHADLTEQELALCFIEYFYGLELAERMKVYLKEKHSRERT